MSRCIVCNYSPTTSLWIKPKRDLWLDLKDKEYYCDKCIEEWITAVSEFDLVTVDKKDKKDE